MAIYTDPHALAPIQCATNIPTWTDTTPTANATKIRKVHVDELRAEINIELVRRGLTVETWTNSTITANATKVRKVHIDELRDACEKGQTGDCSAEALYCPEDTVGALSWTNTITANATKPKPIDITEIRTAISNLQASCICETEQCEYCADCGYRYSYCSHNGVACNDQCGAEGGCGQYAYVNDCASINLAAETEHPWKSSSSSSVYEEWDGTVPWDMGAADKPAAAWNSWTFYNPPGGGATDHSDWNCKCNPYNWTT